MYIMQACCSCLRTARPHTILVEMILNPSHASQDVCKLPSVQVFNVGLGRQRAVPDPLVLHRHAQGIPVEQRRRIGSEEGVKRPGRS